MTKFREGPPKRLPVDPGFYQEAKPKVPRKPLRPEQREQRNLRARARRAQMTPEQKEKERLRARHHRENLRLFMNEYVQSRGGAPYRSSQGVQRGTLAHRLLQTLQSKGPQTAFQLGAGTRFGVPTGTSAQILRLLEREMIERDYNTSTYSLRDKGEEVLQALA